MESEKVKANSPKDIFVVHRGQAVRAIYRQPELQEFEGNPMLEALPPALTDEQSMDVLAYYPDYHKSYRNAPDEIRYLHIQNGMRLFAPLDIHLDLQRRFSCLIRMGYIARNPLTTEYWNKIKTGTKSRRTSWSQYPVPDKDFSWTASGFSIVGMSGVGKSRSILRTLNLYPQVIHHGLYKGNKFTLSQLVWLKLECPFDGNPRGLCINFFKTVDAILSTRYTQEYVRSRRLLDELIADMATVAASHFIGVLVIDETQRLSLAKSGGAEKMLNFFVNLINTIGVPVVLIGTYKAMSVLRGEFSQMRRGTGQGDLIWDRMANDEQWGLLIESLWRYQYIEEATQLTQELSDVIYDESQGITDLAVKIYAFAQERAINSGKEEITPSIIRSAAKDKIGIPRDVLNALKEGNKQALAIFEDVYPTALKDYITEPSLDSHIEGKISQEVISDDFDEISAPSNSPKASPTKGKSKRPPISKEAVLPNIMKNLPSKSASDVYEALKAAGYIKHSSEFV